MVIFNKKKKKTKLNLILGGRNYDAWDLEPMLPQISTGTFIISQDVIYKL